MGKFYGKVNNIPKVAEKWKNEKEVKYHTSPYDSPETNSMKTNIYGSKMWKAGCSGEGEGSDNKLTSPGKYIRKIKFQYLQLILIGPK